MTRNLPRANQEIVELHIGGRGASRTICATTVGNLWWSEDDGCSWRIAKRPIRYEENLRQSVRLQGPWRQIESANSNLGTSVAATDPHARFSISFFGSGLRWIGPSEPGLGIA